MARERKIAAVDPIDEFTEDDALPLAIEAGLSSPSLSEFVGQKKTKAKLFEIVTNCSIRREPMPHMIFSGPSTSGRRTLAGSIARELGVHIAVADSSNIKGPREIIPFLTNLAFGSVLVIVDAERLPQSVSRFLESALESYSIEIVLGEGVNARTLDLNLQPFTCIATSSRPDKIAQTIRRHSIHMEFDPYSIDEAVEIICRKANTMNLDLYNGQAIQPELLKNLVASVHGSIADAMSLLRKAYAVSQGKITMESFRLIGHTIRSIDLEESPSVRSHVLQQMSGLEFERYVAQQFAKRGYAVSMTPATGDHGIDIRLKRAGKDGVVQCKRWAESDLVGERELREFFGSMCHEHAAFGFFVTTSSFSTNAISFAKGKNIALVDGHELCNNADWFV